MKQLFGKDRICGVIAAGDAGQMKSQVRKALALTRTLELRLDYLNRARELTTFLAWLRRQRFRATLIATCRSRRGGGLFRGSPNAQIEILNAAVRAGCGWCDLEIEVAGDVDPAELREALSPARLMISHHDFRKTPTDLSQVVGQLRHAGADAVKIAAYSKSIFDSVSVSNLARGRRDVVAIPMGEIGMAGRILSLRSGSALTYAAVSQATAPGQLSLEAMTQSYRAAKTTRRTRVYGVIGNPIGHSLSPLLHNTAFRARKLDAVFVPFLVEQLPDFLQCIGAYGIAGFGVTIPHKQKILKYLDECDPLAARIGAVNTVVVRGGGRLYGYNTDYVGVLRSLDRRMKLHGSRILLLGAGGAARAAAFALVQAGAVVVLSARRPKQARALANDAGAQAIPRADLRRECFDAIVNCTPLGMYPHGGCPLTADELNCKIVMDMVYHPRTTELLRRAQRKGIKTISGVEMFLGQGFAQYEIWTGKRAPETAMRHAIAKALAHDERIQGSR